MNFLLRLFSCRHKALSRPFTLEGRTYRVCFDCGKSVDFEWGS